MKKTTLGLLSFIFFSIQSFGKVLYYGSETENLTLISDTQTLLKFDEEVKTISQASNFLIEPADLNDPSYKIISIKPRTANATDLVSFILTNDAVVSLKIKTIAKNSPEKTDQFYELRPKESKIDPSSDGIKGADISELELMKAMIRGDNIIGYTAKSSTVEVKTGIDDVVAQLVKVYSGPRFNGYIFKVENASSDKDFTIDLKSLSLGSPNAALLSQVDERVLYNQNSKKSKNHSFLRIVAKPTSTYSALVLPMAPLLIK